MCANSRNRPGIVCSGTGRYSSCMWIGLIIGTEKLNSNHNRKNARGEIYTEHDQRDAKNGRTPNLVSTCTKKILISKKHGKEKRQRKQPRNQEDQYASSICNGAKGGNDWRQ